MPSANEKDIIELTEVIEEGHPDQPNLPPQEREAALSEPLDDLDLEKEIDQIFADLSPPSAPEEDPDAPMASTEEELDLDDLFDDAKAATHAQVLDKPQPEGAGLPDVVLEEPVDLQASEDASPPTGPEEDLEPSFKATEAVMPAAQSDARDTVPVGQDQLAPLLERIKAVEEKTAQLDDLGQIISEHMESRLEAFAGDLLARQETRLTAFGQDLRAELERHFEQKLQAAREVTFSRSQEDLTQALAAQAEEMTALLDSRMQEALRADDQEDRAAEQERMLSDLQAQAMAALSPQVDELRSEWEAEKVRLAEGAAFQTQMQVTIQALQDQLPSLQEEAKSASQNAADVIAAQMEQLRVGLLQELDKAVPAAAARIIREEIQALSQEDG